MPTDYSEERQDAFDDIAEAGTAIDLIVPSNVNTNPDKPWLGSNQGTDPIKHVALFTSANGRPELVGFSEVALIPALGLDFDLSAEMRIAPLDKDGNRVGPEYKLTAVIPLRPDASQPILYTCGFERWPGIG